MVAKDVLCSRGKSMNVKTKLRALGYCIYFNGENYKLFIILVACVFFFGSQLRLIFTFGTTNNV